MRDRPTRTSDLAELYRHMLRIRAFEAKVRDLRLGGEIAGSVHLCNGQEGIYVGSCAAIGDDDVVFATYRGHGWAIACGVPVEPLFAELLGRASGVNGGRGGSAFLSAAAYNFMGENSIVGAGAPIAVGAALAATYDGPRRVAVSAFGDGAMNQGAVHEAMNFAAVFTLPVVFVVENNRYSELTPIRDMVTDDKLFRRAKAYGIPGVRVDGNDVEKVRDALRHAVDRARGGDGPVLVECTTERLVGHYIGDAEHYRSKGEIDDAATREPLVQARQKLLASGASEEDLNRIVVAANSEITAAAEAALGQPAADPATVKEHLYA